MAVSFSACTDIVQLNLKQSEPKIVFEANLNVSDSTCTVVATYSNGFYDTSACPVVNNLTIELERNDGEKYILKQQISGEYFADNVIANQGDEFFIKITDEKGQVYNASAVTPGNPGAFLIVFFESNKPNSIEVDEQGNTIKSLVGMAYWLDIPNEENYYRYKVYKGDKYFSSSYVFVDDKSTFSDTMQIGIPLQFVEKDTIRFELHTINKATYDFFMQVRDIKYAGMNSTSPYNPKGNFDNGAIGYFCVETVVREDFTVFELPNFN